MLNMYSAGNILLSSMLKKLTNLVSLELIIGANYSTAVDDFWIDIPSLKSLKNLCLHYHLHQNKNLLPLFASKLGSLKQLQKVVVEFEGSFQYHHNKSVLDFFKSIKQAEDISVILHTNNLTTMTSIDPIYEGLVKMSRLKKLRFLADELGNRHMEYLKDLFEENLALENLTIELDDSAPVEQWDIRLQELVNLEYFGLKISSQTDSKIVDKVIQDIASLSKFKAFQLEFKSTMYDDKLSALLSVLEKTKTLESITICLDINVKGVTDMQWDLKSELKTLNTKQGKSKGYFKMGQKGMQKMRAVREILVPILMRFWRRNRSCRRLTFQHRCLPFTVKLSREA